MPEFLKLKKFKGIFTKDGFKKFGNLIKQNKVILLFLTLLAANIIILFLCDVNLAKSISVPITAGISVWIYRRFMPTIRLRISPKWSKEISGLLVIGLEVENTSDINIDKIEAWFQILEHNILENVLLKEFVPFTEEAYKERDDEQKPIKWKPPIKILESTKKVERREKIYVELSYYCPKEVLLHCGLQFKGKLNMFAAFIYSMKDDRWTTTMWILPKKKILHEGSGSGRLDTNNLEEQQQ